MDRKKKVLIVGGGASGVITAIALQHFGVAPEQIDIAEVRNLLGEGLAYQTRDQLHRLNVPTARMSAIEALPNDFVEWSAAVGYSFLERQNYGFYLRERLGSEITHIQEYVINLEQQSNGEILATFAHGSVQNYEVVVLAMGHGKARIPDFLNSTEESPRIIGDVWSGSELPQSTNLLCFGTGLSFIDVAMTHLSRNPANQVIAVSGSGNLPERHTPSAITPFAPTLEEVSTLTKLREYLAKAGDSWREAIDGLRPITEPMWRGFSAVEREEFLRTDGSSWSRRRHRIAPDVAEQVEREIQAGRLMVIKGKVSAVSVENDLVTLRLIDGESYSGEYLAVTIGREYESSDPLSLNLLRDEKTNRGPLGMGLSVDVSTGLLLNSKGDPYSQIYAIGPLRSGEAFESTAIPEIRKQASLIAKRVSSQILS